MQIAFVVGTFPELSETFILDQLTGLLDGGHDVVVFGRAPTKDVVAHATVQSYRLLERARHWQRGFKTPLDTLARSLRLLARAPAETAAVWGRSLNVIAYGKLSATGKLWAYASKVLEEPSAFDVVLAHFGTNGVIAQKLRAVGTLDAPLVTVFHGHDLSRLVKECGAGYYRELFRQGDLMLPVSQYFAERLVALGCPRERIRVHHMGVDTRRFEFQARTPEAGAPVRLISVCRLVEKKGIAFGLRALAEAATLSRAPFEWHIVGDGPLRAGLEQLARDLGVAARVTFHGSRTRDEVERLLRGAHVFVAPSVTAADGDQEGVPVAIMEAAASGLPLLSTHHSGIAELVRDGQSGYLVPEWDSAAMARRMVDLIEQPETWARMGAAGRGVVVSEFDIGKLNERLELLLREVARTRFTPAAEPAQGASR